MNLRPADFVTLAHGGYTVRLAPSLRAAMTLEQRQRGFVGLLADLHNFKLETVHSVIRAAAIDIDDANRLIGALGELSLRRVQELTTEPLVTLTASLLGFDHAEETPNEATDTKTVSWADFHRDLFKLATGWLGWTPEQTFNATIPEITLALEGKIDLLKAQNGYEDEDTSGNSEEQRKANIAQGLDPDFDRAGLAALSGMGGVL